MLLPSQPFATVIATYSRAYEKAVSLHDPALVIHQLAAKSRAWAEREIRPDMPGMLRDGLAADATPTIWPRASGPASPRVATAPSTRSSRPRPP